MEVINIFLFVINLLILTLMFQSESEELSFT